MFMIKRSTVISFGCKLDTIEGAFQKICFASACEPYLYNKELFFDDVNLPKSFGYVSAFY